MTTQLILDCKSYIEKKSTFEHEVSLFTEDDNAWTYTDFIGLNQTILEKVKKIFHSFSLDASDLWIDPLVRAQLIKDRPYLEEGGALFQHRAETVQSAQALRSAFTDLQLSLWSAEENIRNEIFSEEDFRSTIAPFLAAYRSFHRDWSRDMSLAYRTLYPEETTPYLSFFLDR